jgi:alkylation response protein AidB-like acyl-CoA dehydrogenase
MNAINTDTMSSERQAFADLAKEIGIKKLAENREEHDKYPFGELFTDAIKDAGVVGFYGVNLPEECGGVGMNTGMVAAILEKLSEVDASLAGIIFTNAAALEILSYAEDTSIYQNIRSLGTTPIAFLSYAGPEEIDMPLADTNRSTVSGKIKYLVLGGIADYAVIPARETDVEHFSYYLVDMKSDKIAKSKPVVSLGMHACPAIDITLHNAPAQLIGRAGDGKAYYDRLLDNMSLCSAAISLGLMRGSLADALQYTADRYQGGRQIIDWGQMRMMLANMAIEVKIAETCLSAACQEMDCLVSGWEKTAQAAAIHIGEMAHHTCTDGVQVFGGNGYMKDYPQEKRLRDSRQAISLLGMAPLRKVNFIARIIKENK